MNKFIITFISGLLVATSYSTTRGDSTKLIFDDNQVFTYKLSFYTTNWADSLEYHKNLDEEYIPARMVFYNQKGDTIRMDSIGVRYKGNSSYTMASTPKKSIKISFDKYVSDRRFYGINRLNLNNSIFDPSFMREKIGYDIARKYMPAPRAAYADIYLEGKLYGLYVQVEQIDKIFLKHSFDDEDGNLYKVCDNGASLTYHDQNQSSYENEYILETNEKKNDWSAFIDMIDKLNNTPDADFVNTSGKCLDLDNCIRHLAFTVVLSHFDSYTGTGRNYYLYSDPSSGQFSIIPWDLNMSFGVHTNNWNVITMDIVKITNLNSRPLNKRIINNDSLKQVYLHYVSDMINGPASPDSIAAEADRIKPVIESHVLADSIKFYGDSNFTANIENDVTISDGPRETNIPGIKSFALARTANIKTQLSQYMSINPDFHHPNRRRTFSGISALTATSNINIRYSIEKAGPVQIDILSIQGKLIKVIKDGVRQPGQYVFSIPKSCIPSGLYTIRLTIGKEVGTTHALVL